MIMRDVLRTGRYETIRQAAYRLADSATISRLACDRGLLCARYGLIETRRLLTDLSIRSELNRRCARALNQDSVTGKTS